MKTIEGLATSSTAMVRRFLCSTDRPLMPGTPTCHHNLSQSSMLLTSQRPLLQVWPQNLTQECPLEWYVPLIGGVKHNGSLQLGQLQSWYLLSKA